MLYDDSNVCIMFSSKFIIFLNKTISSEFFFLLSLGICFGVSDRFAIRFRKFQFCLSVAEK